MSVVPETVNMSPSCHLLCIVYSRSGVVPTGTGVVLLGQMALAGGRDSRLRAHRHQGALHRQRRPQVSPHSLLLLL